MNIATGYLEELSKSELSVFDPSRKRWIEFVKSLKRLNEIDLDLMDPVGNLKKESQKIIDTYPYVFWLNSKSILVNRTTTIAPFEKKWGKPLRKVYRTRLAEILKKLTQTTTDVKSLDSDVKIKILKDLEAEYRRLAGKDNIFRRFPCRDGKKKIYLKIQNINKTIQIIASD